jgi:hypothetical protein
MFTRVILFYQFIVWGTAKQVNIFLVHQYFHNFFSGASTDDAAGAAPVQDPTVVKPRPAKDKSDHAMKKSKKGQYT